MVTELISTVLQLESYDKAVFTYHTVLYCWHYIGLLTARSVTIRCYLIRYSDTEAV